MIKEFKLPDLGEGLTESEIVTWRVAEGDTVELNQIIADVETAKAVVELPSPYAGSVSKLHAPAGTVVEVGSPIVSFDLGGDDDGAPAGGSSSAGAGTSGGGDEAPAKREPNLVGYGAAVEKSGRPARRARAGRQAAETPAAETSAAETPAETTSADMTSNQLAGVTSRGGSGGDVAQLDEAADDSPVNVSPTATGSPGATGSADGTEFPGATGGRPRSTPPVRKLAKDLGVDLTVVAGTGSNGLITRADVQAYVNGGAGEAAQSAQPGAVPATAQAAGAAGPGALSSASAVGRPEREVRIPIKGVRKHTAAAMVTSAFTAPHVTEFLTVDVTPTMELLAKLKASRAFAGYRLTPLTLISKALCIALKRNPSLNTRWDAANNEIVQMNYVNLGIAAATPRGLTVPNIKDAQEKTLLELATALTGLTETARAGKTTPADLSGGTISITNIGVFGIDAGTPILNPGEAAILAVGTVRKLPWEYQDEVALRQVMTLSLSFDHRLVDGEQGSRFLADLGAILAEPGMALTMI